MSDSIIDQHQPVRYSYINQPLAHSQHQHYNSATDTVDDTGNGDDWDSTPLSSHGNNPALYQSIPNLDQFFTSLYHYYCGHGLVPIIVSKVCHLLTLTFTVLFSTVILIGINWSLLVHCNTHAHTSDDSRCNDSDWFGIDWSTPLSLFTIVVLIYLVLFLFYILWHFLSFLFSFRELLRCQHFYHEILSLDDSLLPLTPWSTVLQRIVESQDRVKISIIKKLNEIEITHRILRKENFLIALVNHRAVDFHWDSGRWATRYQSLANAHTHTSNDSNNWNYLLFSPLLESIFINYFLSSMFDKKFELSSSMIGAAGVQRLRAKCLLFGLLLLLLLPFTVMFHLVFFILKHAEEIHSHRSLTLASNDSSNEFNHYSQWLMRDYLELKHFFGHRLTIANAKTRQYLQCFPSMSLSMVAALVSYVSGAVVGILLLLTIVNNETLLLQTSLYDRTLLSWLAIFSGILALARSFVTSAPTDNDREQPSILLSSLIVSTHYNPRHWYNDSKNYHLLLIKKELVLQFPSRLVGFAKEMMGFVLCPLVLIVIVRNQCERIVTFMEQNSVVIDGVGTVCSQAVVDTQMPAHASSDTMIADKREKSLLSFALNHPQWRINTESGQQFLTNLVQQYETENQLLGQAPTLTEEQQSQPLSQSQLLRQRRRVRQRNRSLSPSSASSDGSLSPTRSMIAGDDNIGNHNDDEETKRPRPLTQSDRHLIQSLADVYGGQSVLRPQSSQQSRVNPLLRSVAHHGRVRQSVIGRSMMQYQPHPSQSLMQTLPVTSIAALPAMYEESMRGEQVQQLSDRLFALIERRRERDEMDNPPGLTVDEVELRRLDLEEL